jgi:hypothetical protein
MKCPIDIKLHKEELAEWAYANQACIVEALRQCMDWCPLSTVSRFERCLDSFPKEKPLFKVKQ